MTACRGVGETRLFVYTWRGATERESGGPDAAGLGVGYDEGVSWAVERTYVMPMDNKARSGASVCWLADRAYYSRERIH